MKYKATLSFAGEISAFKGEIIELEKEEAQAFVDCGYLIDLTAKNHTEKPKKQK